jgi:GST-like protein
MITLYGMSSPNVQKVHILLEELGLPFRIQRVDVWRGENFDPAFTALNPLAKVPVIVDEAGPDGEPITVFESGAILQYLAEKAGRFLPARGRARYEVLEWLAVQLSGVGPMFGQYTHFRLFAPPGNGYAEDRYRTQAVRLFEVMDRRLGEVPYLGGEAYSIADIATFPWTRDRNGKWGGNWDGYPNVWRWFDRIKARPAVAKMMAEMDQAWAADRESMAAAPADLVDRILGRGAHTR